MNLNDLLRKQDIDPAQVIVMRHSPKEKELRKIFPWLVDEKPEVFNAYQQSQSRLVENALNDIVGSGYVASFIGLKSRTAVFAGLYRIRGAVPVNHQQFWSMEVNQSLRSFGLPDWDKKDLGKTCLWFDLELQATYAHWIGKLEVGWPPPAIKWWIHANKKEAPVLSISEESRFAEKMPDWRELVLIWAQLRVIPTSWRTALSHWRGVYFIHDASDGKGYVGSASGSENLLGRWQNYADGGDGGDKGLVGLDPANFRFSILQIVAHDLSNAEVIALENTWKRRLHTRRPFGLNEN
ncbi:MAG: GIY-YIG nuclease family protein [Luteolibacter sp.]|uniref:GIY-YIG nuclease family protein n=1 Tax=Luteolibacter sp. TaxID=1962973 RepID=UPI0032657CBA